MQYTTDMLIGGFCLAYGLVTMIMRLLAPGGFSRLLSMQARWGQRRGLALHTLIYSVIPMMVGVVLLWRELAAG